jgi:hypothetical protein
VETFTTVSREQGGRQAEFHLAAVLAPHGARTTAKWVAINSEIVHESAMRNPEKVCQFCLTGNSL